MQIFQLVVFLVSAITLPMLAIILMRSRMRTAVRAVMLVGLAVAARYLLGGVWTPEEAWMQFLKFFVALGAFYATMLSMAISYNWRLRPVVAFVLFMLSPILVNLAFGGSLFIHGFNVGSIVFWCFWTFWGLMIMALSSRKLTRFGRVVIAGVALAVLSFSMSGNAESRGREYVENLNGYLRQNVIERWEPIKRSAEKISSAWDALVNMDRKIMAKGKVGTRKLVASGNIKRQVAKLRKDLLTVDSQTVLGRVKKLDGKIASGRKDLLKLREKLGLSPESSEKLGEQIAKLEADVAALETARTSAVASVRQELKGIGLDIPENSPFFTVDLALLIDNAIVAKNIGFVVENLKKLVDTEKGNTDAAKRYYGAYIVMLDVQSECFRTYLDKAATGIWRDGIAEVVKNAEVAKTGNEAKANAPGRSPEEKTAFLHAAKTNEKTMKAAQAYLAVLQRHEEIMRKKLADTEKRHEIALSFLESVDIASSFGSKAVSDMTDFTGLLELKLPEIAFFDDVAMQTEFNAITQKLMKE